MLKPQRWSFKDIKLKNKSLLRPNILSKAKLSEKQAFLTYVVK